MWHEIPTLIIYFRVTALPAAAPALDWDHYQAKIAKPGLAAEFKKQYTALNIPYPKDNANLLAEIDAEEKAAVSIINFVTFSQGN